MSRTLADWLSYQEGINPRAIELGLDRVRAVWQRMGAPTPARQVITVGGTNGKGSTVAMLEAMLRAAGRRVGCYTSPHLLRYNERIRIEGRDADDSALVSAFERIERARGGEGADAIALTYFEFGTLAALDLFSRSDLDVAVLEVGLGGRLDAVNIIDADVAVVTTVDLDHLDWLGPDRDAIGREKAGIARRDRPVVVGPDDPPEGLMQALQEVGARPVRAGRDYRVQRHSRGWRWQHRDGTAFELPDPALIAPVQYGNAAAAVAAIHALQMTDPAPPPIALGQAAAEGLQTVRVPGRLQSLGGDPLVIVDVAHNPQAARALAGWLDSRPAAPDGASRQVHAVYGALADKDVAGVIAALGERIAYWHLAGLDHDSPRGLPPGALVQALQETLPHARFDAYAGVQAALTAARTHARRGDCILAFGSFFVATAVLGAATG